MRLVEDKTLKEIVFKRLDEIDMSAAELIKDASERGMTITSSAFSKYKSGKKGGLTDEGLLWICCRLFIPVKLTIGTPTIHGDKIINVLPKYNETESLKMLTRIFGRNG